jgi:16S rRNA (uracil1498-N3)-methyltransferase
MHRFHMPPDQCRGNRLTLTGSEAHHAANVLRLRPGAEATVLDGAGKVIACEVETVTKREVHLRVVRTETIPAMPCRITLLLAVPKGKLIDVIIQKATELGVARVVPLLTERVVTHLDGDGAEAKAAKWQQVAVEAIKQCGQAWLPKVEAPVSPRGWLTRGETFDLQLVGALRPGSGHPRDVIRAFQSERGGPPKTIAIWIGPEGDFTPSELDAAEAAGAKPITLGPLVLRVETAAIYCLSFLNYELHATVRP